MKEKISRLAKGIVEETPEKMEIAPESFDEILWPDRDPSFTLGVSSPIGHSLRGVVFCDDERITVENPSFTGRMNHLSFRVSMDSLAPGSVLSGRVGLLTSAGEREIPYRFTIGRPEPPVQEEKETPTALKPDSPLFVPDPEREKYYAFLMRHIPEDAELLTDLSGMLIGLSAHDSLSFAIYKEAVRRGLPVTHLYESLMDSYPEDAREPLPEEVLFYFSYEKDLPRETADRLYRNVIQNVPSESDLYRTYEPAMRDYAMRNVFLRRINRNLSVIYDRMLYPDMIDGKAAALLPDLLKMHRITVDDASVKTAHLTYPELSNIVSCPVKDGIVYLPVYFENAEITFHYDGGEKAEVVHITDEELIRRPDLLKQCFLLAPDHEMLLLSAARKIVSRGIRDEEEKKVLLSSMSGLSLSESFRKEVIRTLCEFGGDTSWIDTVSPAEFDGSSGGLVFQAYLSEGRYREAYLCLKMTGTEGKDPEDLSALCTALLSRGEKPVENGTQTDRFFLCLCKKVFDRGAAAPHVVKFLLREYDGPTEEMYRILKKAEELTLEVTEMAEKTLLCMLFAGSHTHLDDTFRAYTESGVQKELLIRAYFAVRMTDYVVRLDETVPEASFRALERYLGIQKKHESLPVVFLIGLTKYYSKKETLSAAEKELCQELTDILIDGGYVFFYTRNLRNKIRIPSSIRERFYVEYRGTPESSPEMRIRIRPGDEGYRNVPLKKVFGNIFVSGTVLFRGEEMHYLIYDSARGDTPAAEGTISVKKAARDGDDSYTLLNRMSEEASGGKSEDLLRDMVRYALQQEVNRNLFGLEP